MAGEVPGRQAALLAKETAELQGRGCRTGSRGGIRGGWDGLVQSGADEAEG